MTNDKKTSVSELITRYALRMLIENSIANGVGFFHTTALSSSVAIRVDFDLLLTMIGQASYHILANKLRGYEDCGAEIIFRKFVDTPGKFMSARKRLTGEQAELFPLALGDGSPITPVNCVNYGSEGNYICGAASQATLPSGTMLKIDGEMTVAGKKIKLVSSYGLVP